MPITNDDARTIARAHSVEQAKRGCLGCLLIILIIVALAAVIAIAGA